MMVIENGTIHSSIDSGREMRRAIMTELDAAAAMMKLLSSIIPMKRQM